MGRLRLQIYVFLFHIIRPAITVGEHPRVIFTEKDTLISRRRFLDAAKILIEGEDAVTVIGTSQISRINFEDPQKIPVDLPVQWDDCPKDAQPKDCVYNITIVQKSQEANHVFVCGTNGQEPTCCNMNISEHSARCTPSDKVTSIKESMRIFNAKEGLAFVFVESPDSADLYIADSGSQGIHRFGRHRGQPDYHDKEQYYIRLIVSKQGSVRDVPQDKIYGFYNEKNTDRDMFSDMWRPYVTQICTTDIGGPKSYMQFTWTSQLNARLYCGDVEQKQHFTKLLDIATVEADHWQNTQVYGLFQNEWGMRAVCVYKMQDIDNVFKTSPFRNSDTQPDRPRTCVADSTKLSFENLKRIGANIEMEKCIQPKNSLGPLLISYHHHTQITAHNFQNSRGINHTVLFLSLQSGGVHKVRHRESGSDAKAFIIAEYKPFSHRAHIVSMSLNPSTKKLYVASRTEVVQLDVANCPRYGNFCEECVLARDPYCGWSDDRHCAKNGPLQDTEHGNISICLNSKSKENRGKVGRLAAAKQSEDDEVDPIPVPRGSRYFFECPVSSLHAQYTWYHDKRPVSCSGTQQQCLLLISNVQPEQEGMYTCESEEQGHRRELARYQLKVEDNAVKDSVVKDDAVKDSAVKDSAVGFTPVLGLWLCLISALLAQI